MRCSIDMLRLSVKVPFSDFENFFKCYLEFNPYVDFYTLTGISNFKYNFKINETFVEYIDGCPWEKKQYENNFYLAYQHNNLKPALSYYLVIEFNPNKCNFNVGLLNQILFTFFNDLSVDIVSFDCAFDLFDISIDDLIFDKKTKHKVLDYMQGSGRTVYFGSKKISGYTKVYNKAVEQGLKDIIWTRVEYSIKPNILFCDLIHSFNFHYSCPDLVFYNFASLNLNIDIKDRCIIRCLLDGYCNLNQFSRRYSDKLINIINDNCSVRLNFDNTYSFVKNALFDCICLIFPCLVPATIHKM